MKKLTLTILFPILFCTITLAQSTWELKNKADSLTQEQEYSLAAKVYQDIITTDGGSPTMFLNLSLSLSLAGDIDLAYTALDSALLYGYDDLEVIENNPNFKALSKAYPKFQELIDREREFYNVKVIDNEWLLKALSERQGVTLDDSKWDWEWGWKTVGGWDSEKNDWGSIETYPDINLAFTEDSLYDLKDKSLEITISQNNHFELNNIKLKSLQVNYRNSNYRPLVVISDLTNLGSPSIDQHLVSLDKMHTENLTFNVSNLNHFWLNGIIANDIDIQKIEATDLISIYDSQILDGYLGPIGSEIEPSLFLGIRESTIEISSEFLVFSDIYSMSGTTISGDLDFSLSRVNKINFESNQFKEAVSIVETNFYNEQNYMPYNQFIKGFGVPHSILNEEEFYYDTYLSTGDNNLVANKVKFDKLIQSYKKMHSVYREQGDIESANAIYVNLKDLMTKYTLHQYKETGDIEYLIKYQIEKLLKFYTRSGTSPERAILISIYILLGFSIIYLFFPSEWDNQRNKQVIQDYKLLTEKNDAGYLKPFIALSSNAFIVWLNAFSLSLNAFVTLGFGSIPIKGVGKYICIVQGFMGWFLLSIFTVTLINQILI